jgi:hypothetical protein
LFIKKWEFKFGLYPANTMGFIPVDFGKAYSAVSQTDACYSPELAPSTLTVLFGQSYPLSHTAATGNQFNVRYVSNDLEVHIRYSNKLPPIVQTGS